MPIVSPNIKLLFSKTEIEDVEWPKLIDIVPSSNSSFVNDDKDDDRGDGM